jgi:hypothetical protein
MPSWHSYSLDMPGLNEFMISVLHTQDDFFLVEVLTSEGDNQYMYNAIERKRLATVPGTRIRFWPVHRSREEAHEEAERVGKALLDRQMRQRRPRRGQQAG